MSNSIAVSAGGSHVLVLKKDSTLWAKGDNEYGQLGTGNHNRSDTFVMVLSKVMAVAGGNRFTLALRPDGMLWMTGGTGYGEFRKYGIYDNKKRTLFKKVLPDVVTMATSWDDSFTSFCLAIKADGTVWGYGGDGWGVFGRRDLSGFDTWSQIYHN